MLNFFSRFAFFAVLSWGFSDFSNYQPEATPPLSEILNVAKEVDSADIAPALLRELIERPFILGNSKTFGY